MKKLLLTTMMLCGMAVGYAQTDMTSRIANPSFESNFDGWTNDGMANQSNTSFSLKVGSCYAEKWTSKGNGVGSASLKQTLTNLPAGTYTVSVVAQNIQQDTPSAAQTGVTLQAGDKQTVVTVAGAYSVAASPTNGVMEIAFVLNNASGNYVCVDNFTLSLDACTASQLDELVQSAKTLTDKKMNATVLAQLKEALATATKLIAESDKQPTDKEMTDAAATLSNNMLEAQASIEAYEGLKKQLDEADTFWNTNPVNGAEDFKAELDAAHTAYNNATNSDEEVIAIAKALSGAILTCRVANATGSTPKVTSEHFMPVGCAAALGRMTATGTSIKERGYVWATHPNPTVADNRSTTKYDNNGDIYELSPLQPATQYYVRAYAMTSGYAVAYGEEQRIFTLPKATCRWSYDEAGDAATNDRIRSAVRDACDFYNTWTSIPGFHLNAHYVPGAGAGGGTADCSYGGYMRVSQSVSYQRTGTLLHESNHGVGVGTSHRWKNWDGSGLRADGERGDWLGWRATQMVRFFEHNETATLHGDGTHMWPYGINGANEDDNRKISYIANTLVTHAVHQDGLAAVDGIGASAAYTFEYEDNKSYFITNEDASCNAGGQAYLYETAAGTLKWSEASVSDLTDDGQFAWQFEYVPEKAYYRIRNAKSGKYFTYSGATIKTATKNNPGSTENFQLMVGYPEVKVGEDKPITKHGYWIQAGTGNFQPYALTATTTNGTKGTQMGNFSALEPSKQRWIILTGEEARPLAGASADVHLDHLHALINGAKEMIGVDHTDNVENATTTMETTINDMEAKATTITGIAEAKQAVADLETSIRTFISSAYPTSIAAPYDLTCLIAEQDFATTDSWFFNDQAVPTFTNGIAKSEAQKFKMQQTLSDMPAGIYRINAQACQWPEATSYIGNSVINKVDVALMNENDVAAAPETIFANNAYDNEVVFKLSKEGDLSIMAVNNKTKFAEGDITLFTNFRLYYYGNTFTKNEVTAIDDINVIGNETTSSAVYDLTGRRVTTPTTKGIYIINGKKIIRK